jgi:signal transduction histidine kinase
LFRLSFVSYHGPADSVEKITKLSGKLPMLTESSANQLIVVATVTLVLVIAMLVLEIQRRRQAHKERQQRLRQIIEETEQKLNA